MKINKTLYYILNCTWGCILTLIGTFIALALIIAGYKPKRWGGCWYFNVGEWWGGFECGLVFVTDKHDSYHVKCHEYGHSIQNMIFGPFTIFISTIPSLCRYWYRELKYDRKGIKAPTDYDAVWFEGTATKWGKATIDQWANH